MLLLLIMLNTVIALLKSTDYPAEYNVKYPPTDFPMEPEVTITYERSKCTTCCRVIIASDYNFKTNQLFDDNDDILNNERYVMDMEFDLKNYVRKPQSSWEQCILLRPLNVTRQLQFFEFYSYKMIITYTYPKRVHDIKGGAKENSRLIIWEKKPPLDVNTANQRFNYVYNYNYDGNEKWMNYKKHFYLPFSTFTDLCYEAALDFQTWDGNRNNKYSTDVYQIKAAKCNNNEPKQFFTIVYY